MAALLVLLSGLVPTGRPSAPVAAEQPAPALTTLPGALPYQGGSETLPGGAGSTGSTTGSSGSHSLAGALGADAGIASAYPISHIITIVLENQSYDRLFGVYTNTFGMTSSAGIPMVNGAPAPYTCLEDPRQPTMLPTSTPQSGLPTPTPPPTYTPRPCLPPYSVPIVPGATATPLPSFYYGAQDQYDNPHSLQDSSVDTQGIIPALHYRPGLVATPMTGFLERAWALCQQPMTQTYGYDTHNPACLAATATFTAGVPTPTPTPLGAATATPPPFDVMRYMTAGDIPLCWAYAQYYTLADHVFAPLPSYSLPSHLYLVSNWAATCPVSGVASGCVSEPANPQRLRDQLGDHPANQAWPQYAWTDFTYLLDHHEAYVDSGGVPIPTTTPGAFCGTDAQGHPNTYINAQGIPIPTTTPGTCQAAPVSWKYYTGNGTQFDCPNPTPVGPPSNGATCASVPAQPNDRTVEYWNPLPFFSTVNQDATPIPNYPTPLAGFPGQVGYVQRYQQFYDDVISGTLPAVAWLVPDQLLSDHPPYGLTAATYPTNGQALLSWVIYTLATAPGQEEQWDHTVVFVLWDDWGGYYDHVVPPTPVPTSTPVSMPDPGYGIRVPGLLISPGARPGA